MKIIKVILAIIVVAISIYGLITKDFSHGPLSSLLLGILIGIMGIEELKTKGKNSLAIFLLLVSLVIIIMALFSFK